MEGFAPFSGFRTWYRVDGDLRAGPPPLLVVHGGPGYTHDYLESFARFADSGRAVILYDQLGNGRSSPGPSDDPGFWTVDRFAGELENLVAHLGLDRYVLFGHSMGAGIAATHASRRPPGLRGLILANGYAAADALFAGIEDLRRALPPAAQETLATYEADGRFDHPDYVAATMEFYRRHVCRLPEWPEPLLRSVAAMAANPKVFVAAYGPSLFRLTGTLRGWSIAERLARIAVPTLVWRGAFDEVSPACAETLLSGIPDARLHVFGQSSHVPHLEEPEACFGVLGKFLAEIDAVPSRRFAESSA
jgi:L-proline amide hydrolase